LTILTMSLKTFWGRQDLVP